MWETIFVLINALQFAAAASYNKNPDTPGIIIEEVCVPHQIAELERYLKEFDPPEVPISNTATYPHFDIDDGAVAELGKLPAPFTDVNEIELLPLGALTVDWKRLRILQDLLTLPEDAELKSKLSILYKILIAANQRARKSFLKNYEIYTISRETQTQEINAAKNTPNYLGDEKIDTLGSERGEKRNFLTTSRQRPERSTYNQNYGHTDSPNTKSEKDLLSFSASSSSPGMESTLNFEGISDPTETLDSHNENLNRDTEIGGKSIIELKNDIPKIEEDDKIFRDNEFGREIEDFFGEVTKGDHQKFGNTDLSLKETVTDTNLEEITTEFTLKSTLLDSSLENIYTDSILLENVTDLDSKETTTSSNFEEIVTDLNSEENVTDSIFKESVTDSESNETTTSSNFEGSCITDSKLKATVIDSNFEKIVTHLNFKENVTVSSLKEISTSSSFEENIVDSNFQTAVTGSNSKENVTVSNLRETATSSDFEESIKDSNFEETVTVSNLKELVTSTNPIKSSPEYPTSKLYTAELSTLKNQHSKEVDSKLIKGRAYDDPESEVTGFENRKSSESHVASETINEMRSPSPEGKVTTKEIKPDVRDEDLETTITTLSDPFIRSSSLLPIDQKNPRYFTSRGGSSSPRHFTTPLTYPTDKIPNTSNYNGGLNIPDKKYPKIYTAAVSKTKEDFFGSPTTRRTFILNIAESFSNIPRPVEIAIKKKDKKLSNHISKVRNYEDEKYSRINSPLVEGFYERNKNRLQESREKSSGYKLTSLRNFGRNRSTGRHQKRGGHNTDVQKLYRWFYRGGEIPAKSAPRGTEVKCKRKIPVIE